jgi:hypothetical protein
MGMISVRVDELRSGKLVGGEVGEMSLMKSVGVGLFEGVYICFSPIYRSMDERWA